MDGEDEEQTQRVGVAKDIAEGAKEPRGDEGIHDGRRERPGRFGCSSLGLDDLAAGARGFEQRVAFGASRSGHGGLLGVARTPALLGTTSQFIFLYDVESGRVDILPNESVRVITIYARR